MAQLQSAEQSDRLSARRSAHRAGRGHEAPSPARKSGPGAGARSRQFSRCQRPTRRWPLRWPSAWRRPRSISKRRAASCWWARRRRQKRASPPRFMHAAALIGRKTELTRADGGLALFRTGTNPPELLTVMEADGFNPLNARAASAFSALGDIDGRGNHRRGLGAERCRRCQRHGHRLPLPPRDRHQYGPHPPPGRGAGRLHCPARGWPMSPTARGPKMRWKCWSPARWPRRCWKSCCTEAALSASCRRRRRLCRDCRPRTAPAPSPPSAASRRRSRSRGRKS